MLSHYDFILVLSIICMNISGFVGHLLCSEMKFRGFIIIFNVIFCVACAFGEQRHEGHQYHDIYQSGRYYGR